MSTLKEKIAVMEALDRKEEIESRPKGFDKWEPCPTPSWNWDSWEYRVKPKPREFWVNVYLDFNSRLYSSKEHADSAKGIHRIECIRVREVLE